MQIKPIRIRLDAEPPRKKQPLRVINLVIWWVILGTLCLIAYEILQAD